MVLTPQGRDGHMLCGRGSGEGLSRGKQGVGNSLLIPERDKGWPREKEGAPLSPQTWNKTRKEMAENTFFSPSFLVEKKAR